MRMRETRYCCVIILLAAVLAACASYTPAIRDADGRPLPGSVACLEKVTIGGVSQWLQIRGRSAANPILLVIHGGPGSTEGPLVRHFDGKLEEDFLVVNWDQRGAGKSFSSSLCGQTMTIAQFVSDAHDVAEYVMGKYSQEKIFLMGHSWGSLLGVLVVQKYPQLFRAYIGTGQLVNGAENERLSFEYALSEAKATNNQKAIRELRAMNTPEPYWLMEGNWFDKLKRQREWLLKLGGSIYGTTSYGEWMRVFLGSPEYTLGDCIHWVRGNVFSVKAMWPEIMKVDLFRQASAFEVPVYFLIGRHDHQTPHEIAEEYFNRISAPRKELFWFERSAHSPMFEQADAFCDTIINTILPESQGG